MSELYFKEGPKAEGTPSCMIVKTESYTTQQIAKVLQLRANVEGLKMGAGVLEKLASEGEKSSLRCVRIPHGRLNAG